MGGEGGGHSSPSPSVGKGEGAEKREQSVARAAGVLSVGFAVSFSVSCGLMMKFTAAFYCQCIDNLVQHDQAHHSLPLFNFKTGHIDLWSTSPTEVLVRF